MNHRMNVSDGIISAHIAGTDRRTKVGYTDTFPAALRHVRIFPKISAFYSRRGSLFFFYTLLRVRAFFGFFVLEVIYFAVSGEKAVPDMYWLGVLPPSGAWYRLVETALVIAAVILIKKRRPLRNVIDSAHR